MPFLKELSCDVFKLNDQKQAENQLYFFTIDFLPVFAYNLNLTDDERKIYKILSRTMLKSISEIAPYVTFGKSKTTQLLKEMSKKGIVKIDGRGRGTKYMIK